MGAGRMKAPVPRRGTGYKAALAHRISGLALALFLPMHFLALGLVLEGEAAMDSFLAFTDHPVVKAAEWGLVTLLTLHLTLGLRVIVLEFSPWRGERLGWVSMSTGIAVLVGVAFLVIVAS